MIRGRTNRKSETRRSTTRQRLRLQNHVLLKCAKGRSSSDERWGSVNSPHLVPVQGPAQDTFSKAKLKKLLQVLDVTDSVCHQPVIHMFSSCRRLSSFWSFFYNTLSKALNKPLLSPFSAWRILTLHQQWKQLYHFHICGRNQTYLTSLEGEESSLWLLTEGSNVIRESHSFLN